MPNNRNTMPECDEYLDVTDLLCPLTLIRIRQSLQLMSNGEKLLALTADPSAVRDVPRMLEQVGHRLLAKKTGAGSTWFLIEKRC